jgi:hypothetical protein
MSDSRLTNYAFIAGSALAAAGSAGADIITSTGSTTIAQSSGDLAWNTLFSIGQVDVRARNLLDNTDTSSWYMSAKIGGNLSGFAYGTVAISNGMTISTSFLNGSVANVRYYSVSNNVASLSTTSGALGAGSNKLLAFRVAEGTDTFYGWIDYTLSFNDIYSGYTFTVNAWAYNDVSGQGIIAGQNTAAGSQAVPGLGGLAALAIGAAGVRSRRQRTVA